MLVSLSVGSTVVDSGAVQKSSSKTIKTPWWPTVVAGVEVVVSQVNVHASTIEGRTSLSKAAPSPYKPSRNGHEDVEQRPYGPKEPSGWRPRRANERLIERSSLCRGKG